MKKLLIIIGVTVGLNTSIVAGPIFSFGVIADCQYCNIKVPKTAQRQYALSPKKLTACVEHL
ncbi:hypothetical protein OAK15_04690, partial [Verrucomicrobia bacterium]|nr:hypothetical protein [Verrucomicrobiota bacterium]